MTDRSRLSASEAVLAARRIPCICPRQHEAAPPLAVTVAVDTARATPIERVRCTACARTWTRIEA